MGAKCACGKGNPCMSTPSEAVPALKMRLEEMKTNLPVSRDLTDNEETALVLTLASELMASGVDIGEIKKMTYGSGSEDPAPPVLLSAVGAAESKFLLRLCPPHHLACVFAMYGEQNRLRTKAGHENGQDLLTNKVKQLEWLFAGEEGKTWDIVAVDDGCPNNSKTLAMQIIEKNSLKNITVLDLRNAWVEKDPFFMQRGLDEACKKSRKGGAILYGLLHAAATRPFRPTARPKLVMYTDSDLSTDMALCGLLSYGILCRRCGMSMGARYGSEGTFLVKPPDQGAAPHPRSHYEQPNMMKIVLRHYARVRLLPMLDGIYDTQCAFKCFRAEDVKAITNDVQSMGADFDMELLLCALLHFRKQGIAQDKLCSAGGTLFTEDFAESNFMASSEDPDKPYKTYANMMDALVTMHERFIDQDSIEATKAKDLAAFCRNMSWQTYKKMHDKLNKRGPTLFDHPFTLDELKAAAA
mmetsp:Transcript_82579/g.238658  ORF Transcript_82579/g.238658 Transcript_82579/m.238658 type:complete len:469 (-) Transcript_82579:283-1689(-)